MKSAGPFASRDNSMEFRRGHLGLSKREMSIDMMWRDVSMDLMCARKMGSHERMLDSELTRDMSLEFFGNSLRSANRDFSMEMQFPQDSRVLPRGASLELGAFTDDAVHGFSFPGVQSLRDEPHLSKDQPNGAADVRVSQPNNSESRLFRSKIGMSADDLKVHMYGQTTPLYRRGINGSIEDFQQLKHPF